MELIKLGQKTYYIKNNTNIGIYKINETEIYIIDSGNDKDAGKKILKITEEQKWTIKGIICTHSHADHIGGNNYIQNKTNCKILSNNIETAFINYPSLEPSYLYGAHPIMELQNKFLMAKPSNCEKINNNLPEGLEIINLKGHSFDMIGIRTSDNIYFIGDSILSEETINKYHISYIQNIKEYINTLNLLETLEGSLYVPSHINPIKNIKDLIKLNKNHIKEIENKIIKIYEKEHTFEELLAEIIDEYKITINATEYILIGSTIKSFLTYLYKQNKITYQFKNNKMMWKKA